MNELVLIADDDAFSRQLLREVCVEAGYRVVIAKSGREVLDRLAAEERPNVLLVAARLPEPEGLETIRILKEDPDTAQLPIILLTAENDNEGRMVGIRYGAVEFLTKPYRLLETQQRIRNALRVQAAEQLAEEKGGAVDPLTHVGTRRQLLVSMDYEFARAARYAHPLACVVVRVVNFSAIVATAGQEAAEGVLLGLASGLRGCIRGIDHLFRAQPAEFVALLPETGPEGVAHVIARMRDQAKDHSLWGAEVEPIPEVRVGAASYPREGIATGDGLMEAALADVAAQ